MSSVSFHAVDVTPSLPRRPEIKRFIKQIFAAEKKPLGTLTFIFCTDEHLISLNNQYLQHDYYTDILTFDLSESPAYIIGEIYISIDRVKENASLHNVVYANELTRVIFHGVLHLCGYYDNTQADKILMTEKEDFYLKTFQTFHVETN